VEHTSHAARQQPDRSGLLPAITIIHQRRQAVANDEGHNAPHDLAVLSVIDARMTGRMSHLDDDESLRQAFFTHRPQAQQQHVEEGQVGCLEYRPIRQRRKFSKAESRKDLQDDSGKPPRPLQKLGFRRVQEVCVRVEARHT
jgi:hypothetical protein